MDKLLDTQQIDDALEQHDGHSASARLTCIEHHT